VIETPYPMENPRETDDAPVPMAPPPRPVYDAAARPTIPDPVIPLIGSVPVPSSANAARPVRRRGR
jgi:hypothetical protein